MFCATASNVTVSDKNKAQLGSQEQLVDLHDIQWDRKRRIILIKDMAIRLTPTQYRLIAPLQYGTPVTYAELARLTYDCDLDENVRKMMDKQIDRIRLKMYGKGLYIYCILRYGYILIYECLSENATCE